MFFHTFHISLWKNGVYIVKIDPGNIHANWAINMPILYLADAPESTLTSCLGFLTPLREGSDNGRERFVEGDLGGASKN